MGENETVRKGFKSERDKDKCESDLRQFQVEVNLSRVQFQVCQLFFFLNITSTIVA